MNAKSGGTVGASISERWEINEFAFSRFSYNMSLTFKLKFFFEEIGFPLGETENDAINCRHKMLHSSESMGDTEIEKIIRLSFAYRCLVHRTVLKILGYTVTYVDYSMIGSPEKPIDSAIGELTQSKQIN